jgi:subtilisin
MRDGNRYLFLFQSGSLTDTIVRLGGEIEFVGRHSHTVTAWLPREVNVKEIAEDSDLLSVERDHVLTLPSQRMGKVHQVFKRDTGSKNNSRIPWNVQRIWGGRPLFEAGQGVRVGVVDTGIDRSHPDLAKNVHRGFNAVSPHRLPQDDHGHGTHVAGIIGASSKYLVGVAPSVGLFPIKVLNQRGMGSLSILIRGIEWGISHGMHILNISITGGFQTSPSLVSAVHAARANGIFIVAAAGNRGHQRGGGSTVETPAKIKGVLAVAALDRRRRASFSSTGPPLFIAAPGVRILSSYPQNKRAILSGTSQAAPHVSGVAATLKSIHPGATTAWMKQQMKKHAIPFGPPSMVGAGLVQLRLPLRSSAKPR